MTVVTRCAYSMCRLRPMVKPPHPSMQQRVLRSSCCRVLKPPLAASPPKPPAQHVVHPTGNWSPTAALPAGGRGRGGQREESKALES